MKRQLMVIGLAYGWGVMTVLLMGHKISPLPVCENQYQSSVPNELNARSKFEKTFHALEADPFRIASSEAISHNEMLTCLLSNKELFSSVDESELRAMALGLVNSWGQRGASPEFRADPIEVDSSIEFDAAVQQFQSEHRLTLLNDLVP